MSKLECRLSSFLFEFIPQLALCEEQLITVLQPGKKKKKLTLASSPAESAPRHRSREHQDNQNHTRSDGPSHVVRESMSYRRNPASVQIRDHLPRYLHCSPTICTVPLQE